MIIRGILDNSLNGQLCIRGFAPIRELARISRADYSYQRDPVERYDIIDFLEKQTYLFFPEIILGYKFKHSFEKSKDSQAPLSKIQEGGWYKSNVDKTQVKVKTIDYKKTNDLTGKSNIRIVELILDDIELGKLIQEGNHPLSRIDGNHRLRAAEQLDTPKVNQMIAPFCIILGEEFYQEGITASEINDFDKATKVFFYNINTKTVPLTSEENLKVLIDDDLCFPDIELENILGKEGLLVRQLRKQYDYKEFTGILHILEGNYHCCYLNIFELLRKKDKTVKKVLEALKGVDRIYAENDRLKNNSSFGLLYAFLYYKIKNNQGVFVLFKDWVLNNHIFEASEIVAGTIIKIFDRTVLKKIMVFIAMPYFSEDEVEAHNNIYETVMATIKKDYLIDIDYYKIMTYKGNTIDIMQDILDKIKACNIFIANIIDNNPNVTYEMGWARAMNKPIILLREEKSEEPKSDYKMLYYAVYKKEAHTTLQAAILENLKVVLSKEYGIYFNK